MRALTFDKTLTFDARRADPLADDGDTLIKVRQAGVCSTDLEITKGYMGFRGVLGHEFVGVAESGPLQGRRVVGEINCACRVCDTCRAGLQTHCPNRTVLGILHHDGAFADRIAAIDALKHYRTLQIARTLIGVVTERDFAVAWQARKSLKKMTGKDLYYDESAWLQYITGPAKPLG